MKNLMIEGISIDELKEIFHQEMAKIINEALVNINVPTKEEYLTRKQVSEMLQVSLATINNWSNSGILKPKGIGNRVYFLKSDIEKEIISINE